MLFSHAVERVWNVSMMSLIKFTQRTHRNTVHDLLSGAIISIRFILFPRCFTQRHSTVTVIIVIRLLIWYLGRFIHRFAADRLDQRRPFWR